MASTRPANPLSLLIMFVSSASMSRFVASSARHPRRISAVLASHNALAESAIPISASVSGFPNEKIGMTLLK
jgi:hypothetical protein